MRKIISGSIFICCLFYYTTLHSQVPLFVKAWEKMYGSQGPEWFDRNNFLRGDSNGNIYIAVNSFSKDISGNKTDPNCSVNDSALFGDIWVLKLDSLGNMIWNRALGGTDEDRTYCLIQSANDNLIVMGTSSSDSSCEKSKDNYTTLRDGWVVELNTDSNVIWDKQLGNTIEDYFYCGAVAPDGSIILAGESTAFAPNYDVTDTSIGMADIWMVKLDSLGNKIWDEKFGSTSSDFAVSVIVLSNSSYLVISFSDGTKSGDMHDSSFSAMFDSTYYKLDNWILKIDSNGKKIWDNRYGCLMADDAATGAALLNSDGHVVIGAALGLSSLQGNFYPCNDGVADTMARGMWDAWIYKIDTADGHILNERRFGGDLNDDIIQIVETSDKGYLVVCKSNSSAGFEKSENRVGPNQQNLNNYDIWLVRMDSLFNIIWDKTLGTELIEWQPNIILLNDSTFIISSIVETGNSGDVGIPRIDTILLYPRGDIWVSKWYIPNPAQVQEMSLASFNLHPNPVKDILYITLQNVKNKTYHLQVQDMQGRTVAQREITPTNTNTVTLHTNNWQPGVYIVNIEGVSKKVVKLN